MESVDTGAPAAPAAEAVRGLGRELARLGYANADGVSPFQRPLTAAPREALRFALMPEAPMLHCRSVLASRQQRRLARVAPAAWTLFRLYTLGEQVTREDCDRVLGRELVTRMVDARLVDVASAGLRARFRLSPLEGLYFLSDFAEAGRRYRRSYVQFGLDTALLARFLARAGLSGTRALDLCTGSGAHALLLAHAFQTVVGVDLNPRAIALSRANAALNSIDNATFAESDLYAGVQGRFDLVVSNPPFVAMPEEARAWNMVGHGGMLGIDLTLSILEGLDGCLGERGQAFIHTQGPTIAGRCRLVEETRARLRESPLEIEFVERYRTGAVPFPEIARRFQVQYFTVYRIEVRRANRFRLRIHPLRGYRAAGVAVGVALERLQQRLL
jgi:SAM-dependent methyltransferase